MLGYTQEMLVTANEAKIEARDAGTTTTRRRQLTGEFSYSPEVRFEDIATDFLEPRFWIFSGLPTIRELTSSINTSRETAWSGANRVHSVPPTLRNPVLAV
jgi:hypothetical protein